MIRDHLHTASKFPCRIVTVDPLNKTVQGTMRTGPVHISVYTTNPFFRWPVVGENWIICQINGSWHLDSLLQDPEDLTQITALEPGEGHLNVKGKIHTADGKSVTRKHTEIVGDGSKKAWTIKHDLNDYAVQVSATTSESSHAPITAFTWAPVLIEEKGSLNELTITFSVAPITKGALVVVIG